MKCRPHKFKKQEITDFLKKKLYDERPAWGKQDELIDVGLYYIPAYHIQWEYDAQWAASFGYIRPQYVTVYRTESIPENPGHYRSVPHTQTQMVTDWHPARGTESGQGTYFAFAGALKFPDENWLSRIVTELNWVAWKDEFASGATVVDHLPQDEVITGEAYLSA